MHDEQRRKWEARTGILTFLAGVWLIAAPLLLDFGAAQRAFRPYWAPLALAVVIMLVGMVRALAPLDVPWLRTINISLATALVVAALLVRDDVSPVVQVNQILVGVAVVTVSLAAAVDAGDWLG